MYRRLFTAFVVFATVAAGLVPAAAASAPVRSCADLVREFDVPDAHTRVTSASVALERPVLAQLSADA